MLDPAANLQRYGKSAPGPGRIFRIIVFPYNRGPMLCGHKNRRVAFCSPGFFAKFATQNTEYLNTMNPKYVFLILSLLAAWGADAQTTRRKAAPQIQQGRPQQKRPVYRDVTYVVDGRTSGYADGEWVKLCIPAAGGLKAHDSVRIKDGRFRFSGKTKNVPYMQYITVGEGIQKNITELLLEEGTIAVQLTAGEKKDRVTGTPHNDIYMPYRDSLNDIYTKMYACLTEAAKLSNSKDDRESYSAGADMLRKKIITVSYDYAAANMTNWVGVYLFAEYYKRFSLQQNRTLLAKMSRKYGNLPITAEIRKYVNKQKQPSRN